MQAKALSGWWTSALAERAVRKDLAAQAAPAAQPLLVSGGDGLVHPQAGPAFLHAEETHALDLELLSHQGAQVQAPGEDVAAHLHGPGVGGVHGLAEGLEGLHGEEGDLALVVGLVVEEAVAADAPARHAFQGVHLD